MTSAAKHRARSHRNHQAKRQIMGNFERTSLRRNFSRSGSVKRIPLLDRLRYMFGGREREPEGREEVE